MLHYSQHYMATWLIHSIFPFSPSPFRNLSLLSSREPQILHDSGYWSVRGGLFGRGCSLVLTCRWNTSTCILDSVDAFSLVQVKFSYDPPRLSILSISWYNCLYQISSDHCFWHFINYIDFCHILYCCPDCLSCPVNAIQMDRATWAVWAAIKKYSFTVMYPVTSALSFIWRNCSSYLGKCYMYSEYQLRIRSAFKASLVHIASNRRHCHILLLIAQVAWPTVFKLAGQLGQSR